LSVGISQAVSPPASAAAVRVAAKPPPRPGAVSTKAKDAPEWRAVALFLVAVVLILPLPFGSWSLWASSALTLAVGLVLAALGALGIFRPAAAYAAPPVPLRLYAVPLTMYAAVLLWACVQATSWTPAAWHNPFWRAAAEALGTPLSGAISLDPAATLRVALELATYGALFWLALQTSARATTARLLVRAVILSGLLYALYGLGVYFTHTDRILWFQKQVYLNNVTATFENRNNFATFAGMATIAAVGLFLNELGKLAGAEELRSRSRLVKLDYLWKRAWPYIVAVAALATALLLSASRAGMVTTLLGVLALLVTLRGTRGLRRLKFRWLLVGAVALAAAALLLSGHSTLARFDVKLIGEEARGPAWLAALDSVRAYPWLGTGLGAFEPAFRMVRTFAVDGRFMEAHSDVLENMVELGVPAAMLLNAVLVLLFVACAVGARARRRDAVYPAIAAAVTVQVGLHAFVDFSTQVPAVVVSYVVLLAAGFAQSFRMDELHDSA
jgi:O-antigen ligase